MIALSNLAPFRILNRARRGSIAIAVTALLAFQTLPLHAAINVVSYWRMGENDPGGNVGSAATKTIDSVGTNNLTFHGAGLYTNDVATTAAHAASSLSVIFTNGVFATNAIVSTNIDDFGIECWAKPTALGTGEVIAYNGSTGGIGDGGWGIIIAADHTYEALFGGVTTFGTNVAVANVWTHLALVRASGISTLYVNGVAAATNSSVPGVLAAGAFALAAPPQSPTSQFFTGLIDEVRLFTFAPGQFRTNDLLLNTPIYSLVGTTSLLEGPTAGSDSVLLAVSPQASHWVATANAAWLHLTPANQFGTGSTNVVFTFDANAGATRTGTVSIVGQTISVVQAGATYVAARPATTVVSAGLTYPYGLTTDASGNLYIADAGDNAIREWLPASDTVTTVVPGGLLNYPSGVAVDQAGNVYIADNEANSVEKWITASNSLDYLVYGALSYPIGVALDRSGNVYIGDSNQRALKMWSVIDGSLITLVSSGLTQPSGVAVDLAGNVFIADGGGQTIKKWTAASGTLTTLVSSGLAYPYGVAVDGSGNVYIADTFNFAIRKWVAAESAVVTLVSSGLAETPGVAVDAQGNVFMSDQLNSLIKEQPYVFVDPTTRMEDTNAGTDLLSAVLPATANMSGPFSPTSDQSWLTIGTVANGVVEFSFTANYGATRTGHITLFGALVPIIQAGSGLATPPILTGATMLSNGAFQFSFTNNNAASFTVISTTNVSLSLSQWTVIGAPTNVAPGLFQFTSVPATNEPRRFYSVRSP